MYPFRETRGAKRLVVGLTVTSLLSIVDEPLNYRIKETCKRVLSSLVRYRRTCNPFRRHGEQRSHALSDLVSERLSRA